jgi:hypothetical protein
LEIGCSFGGKDLLMGLYLTNNAILMLTGAVENDYEWLKQVGLSVVSLVASSLGDSMLLYTTDLSEAFSLIMEVMNATDELGRLRERTVQEPFNQEHQDMLTDLETAKNEAERAFIRHRTLMEDTQRYGRFWGQIGKVKDDVLLQTLFQKVSVDKTVTLTNGASQKELNLLLAKIARTKQLTQLCEGTSKIFAGVSMYCSINSTMGNLEVLDAWNRADAGLEILGGPISRETSRALTKQYLSGGMPVTGEVMRVMNIWAAEMFRGNFGIPRFGASKLYDYARLLSVNYALVPVAIHNGFAAGKATFAISAGFLAALKEAYEVKNEDFVPFFARLYGYKT